MLSSERTYVDLLFRASRKYASWDPEVVVKVGDYGKITQGSRPWWAFWRAKNGTFMKEGNVFLNGMAEKHGIPEPIECDGGEAEGETWIVSQSGEEIEISRSVRGITPAIMQCNVKGVYKFSSGRGAILVMNKDTISVIDTPGALGRLLEDPSMHGFVVVSEVHRCSSYARLLTTQKGETVALGLSIEPPAAGVASAAANAKWLHNCTGRDFRYGHDPEGSRKFYLLFRLVGLKEEAPVIGIGED
ncbi:hypothetical protein C8R44DRAFT_607233 [Mycena epipterygia]|nr:hypothetical protein C8R44DRAFT_607233 [Mycena epipterygia]